MKQRWAHVKEFCDPMSDIGIKVDRISQNSTPPSLGAQKTINIIIIVKLLLSIHIYFGYEEKMGRISSLLVSQKYVIRPS